MQDHIFEECHTAYLNAKPGETFWSELAKKFNFKSGEVLRKKVQKEREKRNLPPKSITTIPQAEAIIFLFPK